MRINILDCGLSGRPGHHFEFDRRLVRYLVESGHDVRVYGFKSMDDEVFAELSELAPVTRLFRYFHYEDEAEFDAYAPEMLSFFRQSDVVAREMAQVESADLSIWPTIKAHQAMACALVRTKGAVVGCIHHDPGIQARSVGAMLWRVALKTARRNKVALTIGSIEAELRYRFLPIVPDKRFPVFPQPFEGPARAKPSPALRRVGFFGHHREEKGTELARDLLKRLCADGYAVTFQTSGNEFEVPEHPSVDRLGFVDDLAAEIRKCDLVVLPYDIEAYTTTGSGILAQALPLGIPVAAPLGTIPGRTVEQLQVGPLFPESTPAAVYAAIKYADANYAQFASRAARVGAQLAEQYGPAQFAEALLAVAR